MKISFIETKPNQTKPCPIYIMKCQISEWTIPFDEWITQLSNAILIFKTTNNNELITNHYISLIFHRIAY